METENLSNGIWDLIESLSNNDENSEFQRGIVAGLMVADAMLGVYKGKPPKV